MSKESHAPTEVTPPATETNETERTEQPQDNAPAADEDSNA